MLNKIALSGLAIATFGFGGLAFATTHSGGIATHSSSAMAQYVAASSTALASGQFDGRSDHVTKGQVTLTKTDAGYQLRFSADFFLDGAPDPVVALGNGEVFDVANKISVLKKKKGTQSYQLPASFTPGQFSQVLVWCEKFSVPLGVAELTDI